MAKCTKKAKSVEALKKPQELYVAAVVTRPPESMGNVRLTYGGTGLRKVVPQMGLPVQAQGGEWIPLEHQLLNLRHKFRGIDRL